MGGKGQIYYQFIPTDLFSFLFFFLSRSVGMNWWFICLFPPTTYTSLYSYVLSAVSRKSNFTLYIYIYTNQQYIYIYGCQPSILQKLNQKERKVYTRPSREPYLNTYRINIYKVLSDERLGAKLRVTENRCVLFDSFTYIYSALLPQY